METEKFAGLCNRYSVATFLLISVCQAFVWGSLDRWLGMDILAIPWMQGDLVPETAKNCQKRMQIVRYPSMAGR